MTLPTSMRYVLFRSSFRHESAPNISHVTKPDGSTTWCGLRGWYTNEDPYDPEVGVDCLRCKRALDRAAKENQ